MTLTDFTVAGDAEREVGPATFAAFALSLVAAFYAMLCIDAKWQ